jgi:phage terminase large subunit-like protein
VIIMQRVHEDDLTGHVMKVKEEGWLKLSFPMEAEAREITHFPLSGKTYVREAGDPLWEERFPKSMFPATRARLGSYGWAGQMQQRPSPLGGGMFQRSWWKFYDKLPEKFDHLFFSIDCAFKDKNTSDYVAGIAIGQVGAKFYLLPIAIHDRLSFGRTKEAIGLLSEKIPGAGEKLVEDKANGTAVIDDLRDSIPGLIAVEPQGGKMARAHDDWVDTLSQAIIRATQGRPGFLEFMRREAEAAIEKRKQEQEAATAKKGTVVQKGNMMINGPNAYIRRHQP